MAGRNIYRKLGKTNSFFFPLGLGTASFAGVNMVGEKNYKKPSDSEISLLINSALKNIDASEDNQLILDTSNQYGESEKRISRYIKKNPKTVKKFFICTKWGLKFKEDNFAVCDYSIKNLKISLEQSLKLLQKIDLYYIHTNPSINYKKLSNILDKKNETILYLNEIKKNNYGGIKYLGISISNSENLEFLLENKYLLSNFDVLQINSNILFENPKIMEKIYSLKIGIILNSVYRKGNKAVINKKDGLCNLFYKILDSNKNVIVLTGTKSIDHLRQNIDYVKYYLENKK